MVSIPFNEQFAKKSKQVQQKMWWQTKRLQMGIGIGVFVVVLTVLIVLLYLLGIKQTGDGKT